MADLEKRWGEFLDYLRKAPTAGNPGALFAGFHDELIASGLPPEQASSEVKGLVEFAATRDDWTALMFDRIYAHPRPGFSVGPNALLVEMTSGRQPGWALDVAMGQGRNALYLASIGWKVTGFDVSGEGIAAARRSAAELGLELDALLMASENFDYGRDRWDLIVMTYALVPVTSPSFAGVIVDSLRQGGMLIVESFASDAVPRLPVTIAPNELRQAYQRLQILRFEDETRAPEWASEPTRVVRMAATKT